MFKNINNVLLRFVKSFKRITGDIFNPLLVLILVLIIATILRGTQFLSAQNIINILRSNSIIGIIAMGMTMVIISGGIDLSVGSTLVIISAVIITVANNTGSIILGIFCGLGLGIFISILISVIVTKGNVPPFIATLGMMNICRSLSQFYMQGGGMRSTESNYRLISNSNLFNIPLPIYYLLAVTIIVWFISQKTVFGRHIYAVGSNERAAKLSSVNINRVKMNTYILIGICVSIAAVVESSRMNSINASSSGQLYELDAISAVVVGGTRMSGGKGSVIGTFFGILIIGILNNMLVLMGIQPFLVNTVKGIIVILAVLLQHNKNPV